MEIKIIYTLTMNLQDREFNKQVQNYEMFL